MEVVIYLLYTFALLKRIFKIEHENDERVI